MNLAVHGLAGDIQESNTYYEDPHDAVGKFDYVMANPPFNVNKVDKPKLEDDPRFPFGLPKPDNANYLWIQIFYSALNTTGRAGFVMANSASDARSSELEIRKQLIQTGAVDCIVAVGTNMFYTVTLPVTLWFLDNNKPNGDQANEILFIDARDTYEQVDRAHRTWTPTQIEFLANIHRLANNTDTEVTTDESQTLLDEHFPDGAYTDVLGLCKVATIDEIEVQGWSLNPGRYVGVKLETIDEGEFEERITKLANEFNELSEQATELTATIQNVLGEIVD
jgi:type I restriction enzyme M protein